VSIDISQNALIRYKTNHPITNVVQCDLKQLPFKDNSFDYIYNLGVMEHFYEDEIHTILGEFSRILHPNGKVLLMWAPKKGGTVYFFRAAHYILNHICDKGMWFHPPEPTLINSKEWITNVAKYEGLTVIEYSFGLNDIYTYVNVLLQKENR
jgi:ubiquinone/menaquinone biosynthesis C-methylase UbiE